MTVDNQFNSHKLAFIFKLVTHVTIILIYRVKWVKIDGIKYNTSSLLVIGHKDDYPLFGKIAEIYTRGGTCEVHFQVNIFDTKSFDLHYHAFAVESTSKYVTLPYEQIYSYHPLTLNYISGILFVVLKHHIVIPFTI